MMALANDIRSGSGLRLGLPLAIGAALAFGTSGALARGMIDAGWTPGAAVTARIWVASLVLLVPTVIALRGRWRLLLRNTGIVAAYGLFAVMATQLFYFQAVAVMDVGIALLIEYTAPVAVVLWLWMRRGERPTPRSILGALIAFAGLVLMLDVLTGRSVDVGGVLWAFGAMIGAAAYFILSGKSDTGLPPIALAGSGLFVGAFGLSIAGLVGILPMAWSTDDVAYRFGTGHWSAPWFVPVLAIGIISTALAYVLGITSTRLLGSRLGSFIALAEVVAAVLFGWILLGQLPNLVQAVGAVLVLAGVVVVKLGEPTASVSGDPALASPGEQFVDALDADGLSDETGRAGARLTPDDT